jgi:hypothetical protein
MSFKKNGKATVLSNVDLISVEKKKEEKDKDKKNKK